MGFRDMDALLQRFVENGPAGCGCAIAEREKFFMKDTSDTPTKNGNCLLRRIRCTDSIR